MLRFAASATIVAASVLDAACAQTRIVAAGRVAADARDAEGETIGGIGSAIEIVPGGVVMLSDRGAGDGALDYRPRMQFFRLDRDGAALNLALQKTVLLRDTEGRAFTGLLPDLPDASPPRRADGRMCLDPEGIARTPDGNFFVSEEYMPSVLEFAPDGSFVRRFGVPDDVVPRTEGGRDFATEERDDMISGRESNRGFEGLALLPDGRLAAILQSGLAQDGGRRAGFSRLVIFDTESGEASAAYRVPFSEPTELDASAPAGRTIESKHLVYSALAPLPDGRLLALERDNFGADGSVKPRPARYKAVVLLDLTGADNLLAHGDPSKAEPVKRTVLFNLAALDTASAGLSRGEIPAKWEGLAVVGVADGKLRLLLSSDNDFLSPVLHLKSPDGTAHEVAFPRAKQPQDTWVIEIETPFPPPNSPWIRNNQSSDS